jgi:hypothetical protein
VVALDDDGLVGLGDRGSVPGGAHARTVAPARARPAYLICIPEIARAMTMRWISLVPSKIV